MSFDWDTAPADVVAAHYTYQGLGVSRDSVVGADDTFFDPGTVVCGETYTIAVAWLDDEGQWGPSSNASGTALDCNPFGPGPTGLHVTAATTIRLTYAWDAYGGPGIWFVRATAAGGAGYVSHSRGALSASTGGLRCSTQYVISVQWVFTDGTVSEPSSLSAPTADCPPPHVSTGGATNVTTDSAVLTGSVDPNGLSTSYHFEWGATTDYGSSTAPQDAGVGTTSTAVAAGVSGLQQATVYHYRLAATSSSGTTYGVDHTFMTGKPLAPTQPVTGTPARPAPRCIVPRLKGLTLSKAKRALHRGHCALGKTTKKRVGKTQRGKVLASHPRAGSRRPAGTKVALLIGR